jgi:hypothetical protein
MTDDGLAECSSRSFENILCIFSVELQYGFMKFPGTKTDRKLRDG